eukprot:scaffold122804_cov37-Tisochrysis_lutea.AAC.3
MSTGEVSGSGTWMPTPPGISTLTPKAYRRAQIRQIRSAPISELRAASCELCRKPTGLVNQFVPPIPSALQECPKRAPPRLESPTCGTTRMSEKRIAASTSYLRTGCIVTSVTSAGSSSSWRKFFPFAALYSLYSGKCRPAWRKSQTGTFSTFRQPERKGSAPATALPLAQALSRDHASLSRCVGVFGAEPQAPSFSLPSMVCARLCSPPFSRVLTFSPLAARRSASFWRAGKVVADAESTRFRPATRTADAHAQSESARRERRAEGHLIIGSRRPADR